MVRWQLFYWPVPFRGQFVRAVLAFGGARWEEAGAEEVVAAMGAAPEEMAVPFMGPPMLVDREAGVALAQMPAIVLYLGEVLGGLPGDAAGRAAALKVVCDANDVLDDATLDGGRLMWTARRWEAFEPRLRRWMGVWRETGRRHGLRAEAGWLLGGAEPDVADIVTGTLWTVMGERFPPLAAMLEAEAPEVAGLSRRVAARAEQKRLLAQARRDWGEAWCGGRIEESLRRVVG